MGRKEVEEKIIKLAHEWSKKYGEEVLQLDYNELIAYITPFFNYQEWLIFKHNEYQMLALFIKTVKQDLSKS